MPRASWKGFLRLSLVSCPVYLSPATTRTKSIRLHQVWQPRVRGAPAYDEDEDEQPYRPAARVLSDDAGNTHLESLAPARIALHPHDPHTGEEIGREDVVKGYEYERGRFVTFTAEELKALDVESSKIIDLETFVPRAEVDPVYFSTPYYVYPDGPIATETFGVIGAAMGEAGTVGIGRVTLSRRERLVMVEPRGAGMVAIILRSSAGGSNALLCNGSWGGRCRYDRCRGDDHETAHRAFRPGNLPGPLSGGTARADRGENERAAGEAERDFQTAAGGRPDGSAEAQPRAGNRRSRKTKAQGRRRSPANQPAAAGIRKKADGEIAARSRTGRAAPQKSVIRPRAEEIPPCRRQPNSGRR